MEVSDSLTWLAEAILEEVLILAWQSLTMKHGLPGGVVGDSPGFLIVGYGKLGGIELGHGSDLDLVFLYSADGNLMTVGDNSISNESFFTRLGQRIIHFLGTATAAGILYDVDMRLRPSGNAGLLVSSFNAFSKYQDSGAWTWEHQALVRARGVAGDAELAEKFAQLRSEILGQKRDVEILKRDVVAMRDKMIENLGLKASEREIGKFHLKQDPGGIVDIEFMVQFAVLAQAHSFPGVARWSDNIRILDALSEYGIVSEEENRRLTAAYIAYRSAGHRLQLQQEQNIVAAEEYADHRSAVIAVWQRLFGDVLVSNEEGINVV
jgi:[glutamine synthetase] adenylyltransferase / [glutamine synthetase]-adenylyl-L-tyrosine phosphorylase